MKTKKNDLVPYILMTVTGVIITGIIIFYMVSHLHNTMNATNDIVDNTEQITSELADYNITKYDGEEIRGSQVRNFIKERVGDYSETETAPIYVEVTTAVSGTVYNNTYVNKRYIKNIKEFADAAHYINPTAWFTCEVLKTTNKAIIGIAFIQR